MTSPPHGPRPAIRRRVLVCTPFPPRLDARHGGKATAQLLLRLAARNEVALLCLRTHEDMNVDPAIAEACARLVEVPVRTRSRAGRRIASAVALLRGVPPWAGECRSADFRAELERLLDEWRPEIVEIHLQAMAQYVDAAERRNVPAILVDYDPPSAWAEDLRRAARGLRRLTLRAEVAAWRRYERATRRRFGVIVVFAERDVEAVAADVGEASIVRVPLAVDVPAEALDPTGTEPPTIVFVGGFAHPPNVDAALWLGRTIFPRVLEQIPQARLEIVGHEPGEEVLALAGGPVSVHASVPDVTPFLDRAALVVAPIRIGGSMRMKVLEALAAGKALVATPRAAEGLEALAGDRFLLAASEEEFAAALVELLRDPHRRRELAQSARRWAETNLGWDAGVEAFERLYDTLADARAASPPPVAATGASGRRG